MEASFWHDRWESNQIGFHQAEVNRLLAGHLDALALPDGARIFLPMCGKTRDIGWLMERGYRIAGAELSEVAVKQLFADLALAPTIAAAGNLRLFSAGGIDVFAGDIFALTSAMLGDVDAVYDRAALVALPAGMRARHAAHIAGLTRTSPQLLICFEYDQAVMQGPPFSVPAAEVDLLYSDCYHCTALETAVVPGGLKGVCPADETAWLLRRIPPAGPAG